MGRPEGETAPRGVLSGRREAEDRALGRRAEGSAEGARQWYERQREGLGVEFVRLATETLRKIVDLPDLYPVVHADVRRAIMPKFPYGVFYRQPGGLIRVIAILDLRSDPKRVRRRK